MRGFAFGVEHPLDGSVQGSHHPIQRLGMTAPGAKLPVVRKRDLVVDSE